METSDFIRVVEWLLDLEQIRLGRDAPLSLYWQMGVPQWLLVPLAALASCSVLFIYRRERGGLTRRLGLAGLRVGLIGLLLVMMCGPVLRLQRNRTEPAHVAILVDRTRSMEIRDAVGGAESGAAPEGVRRIDAVREALLGDRAAAVRALLSRNRVELYTFDRRVTRVAAIGSVEELSVIVEALGALACGGTTTNVPRAIEEVLGRRESGRLAAIILASDGRSTEAGSVAEVIDSALARQVPIYTLAVGSEVPGLDVSLGAPAVAENVFLKDLVALRVPVGVVGLSGSAEVTVRVVDNQTGSTLAEETVVLSGDAGVLEVEMQFHPERAGRVDLRVEVEGPAGEVTRDNNSVRVQFQVMDEQIRVLYVDGYPRYEYRYLKNALLREPTIRSSCLLLSADAGFAQEGTDPIRRFPESPEELRAYDVVLLGDVDPLGDWLSPVQAEMLVEYVAEHGGGLGVLAGPRHAPHDFRGTILERLLPVRLDPEFDGSDSVSLEHSYKLRLTQDGRRSRLFRFLGEDDPESYLGGLYWRARTLGPKAGATVLARNESRKQKVENRKRNGADGFGAVWCGSGVFLRDG